MDQNIEGALWTVCLRTTIGQNGNERWNKQPQQSLYEEEEKSPEAESFDPLTYFHARTILGRDRAKQQKAGAATFKAKSLVPLLASEIKTFLGQDNIKAPALVIDIAPN